MHYIFHPRKSKTAAVTKCKHSSDIHSYDVNRMYVFLFSAFLIKVDKDEANDYVA